MSASEGVTISEPQRNSMEEEVNVQNASIKEYARCPESDLHTVDGVCNGCKLFGEECAPKEYTSKRRGFKGRGSKERATKGSGSDSTWWRK